MPLVGDDPVHEAADVLLFEDLVQPPFLIFRGAVLVLFAVRRRQQGQVGQGAGREQCYGLRCAR